MTKYPKYKISGVEGIEEIPDCWDSYKLKYLVDTSKYYQIGDGDHGSIKPEMYSNEGNIPYIRVQNLSWNGKLIWEGMVYISKEHHYANLKSKIVPNDILIAKTGATVGKLALIPDTVEEANTTSSVGKISVNQERFDPKFILYSMMSKHFKDQIWIEASQKSAQPGFNIDDLVFFRIVCPKSKPDQTAIANFLDEKTAKIDKLITNKQKLIEHLKEERTAIINQAVTKGIDPNVKFKPSGIDWLGDIPEHFKVKKLKYVVSKVGSGITPRGGANVYQNDGIPLLRSQNIYNDGLRLEDVVYISEEIDNEMSNSRINDNDVLLNITGASIGRCFYVPEGFGKGNVNQHVCIIRPIKHKILTNYLHLLLISGYGQSLIDYSQNGANREGLNFQEIKSFDLALPDIVEQKKVLIYIETQTKQISSTISKIEKEIELLHEYRTALISEVVTGKIKVM